MNTKKELSKYRITYASVVGGVSILAVIALLLFTKTPGTDPGLRPEPTPTGFQACTLEAKICPDGTYVGRVGPKCEYEACPSLPDGITPLLKGTNLPRIQNDMASEVLRSSATRDDQLQELLLEFLGPLDPPACATTVTGEYCITHKDLGGLTIDWNTSFVVGTSLGIRASGGYEISITGFEEVGSMLYVFVQEKTPGPGCFSTEALTNPYIVAKLDVPATEAAAKTIVYKVSTVAGPACQE